MVMVIRPLAFANALAVTSTLLALLLVTLRLLSPSAFIFVFNAQFFGADVASLLPTTVSPLRTLAELLAFVGGAWGFGLIGAILYNRFAQGR